MPDFRSIAHVSAHQKKTRKASLGFLIAICLLAGAFSLFQVLSKVLNSKADSAPTISNITPNSGPTDGGTNVTISGTNFLVGNDSYTKLLLHNDVVGTSFTDSSATPKAVTVAGNANQTTAQSKFGGSSAYFDGNGDYVSVSDSEDWNFGTGDFTIDMWAYLTALPSSGGYSCMLSHWQDYDNGYGFCLKNNAGSYYLTFWNYPGGSMTIQDDQAVSIAAGAWHHFAVVRSGNTFKLFMDGVQQGSDYVDSDAVSNFANNFYIGSGGLGSYFSGFLDEVRVSKGVARWTSNFTPSSVRYGSTNVTIGGTQATNISITDPTTATMTTPAHTAGVADVIVTNDDNKSATLSNGFTFMEPAPTISSITPDNGLTAGGTNVSISGSNFFYGNDSNTKLLIHGDGSGASFSDSSATSKSITANGNATQSAAQSKFGGKSAYFDGSGDYLSVPDSDDWNLGTGDFTIDFWVNASTIDGTARGILTQSAGSGGIDYVRPIQMVVSDGIRVGFNDNALALGPGTISANQWHHVAVVRNGSNFTLYIDGISVDTETSAINIGNSAVPLSIGRFYYNYDGYYFNGYLDEVRFSKGIARWTSNFTPPTSRYGSANVTFGGSQATNVIAVDSTTITATTPTHAAGDVDVVVTNDDSQNATLSNGFTYHNIPAPTISSINPTSGPSVGGTNVEISGTGFGLDDDVNTKLLLHGDGSGISVSDFSPNAKTITANGNATQSETQSKFGGKSMYFDGSGDYLSVPDSDDWNFGSGDFTIDGWINIQGGTDFGFYSQGDIYSSIAISFTKSASWQMLFGASSSGTSWNLSSGWVDTNIVENGWYHVALVRQGSIWKSYVNGQNIATVNSSVNPYDSSQSPYIGLYHGASSDYRYFNGYLDELRISKGIARWTSDFTPPVAPYAEPNVTFDGTSATDLKLASPTNIFASTPAHADGTVDVVVTNDDDQSNTLSNAFTYVTPPTITSITPSSGNTTGGDTVTITGSDFVDTPDVTFGGTEATSVTRVDSNTLSVVIPANNAGAVDVVVTNPDNQEATLVNGFTYINDAPTISSITPNLGLKTGGETVTISGSNFTATPAVSFGGTNSSSVAFVDSNTLSVVVPAHDAGAVDVVITNPDSQTATLTNGFTFTESAPTISSITPTSGPIAGGTNVTISGTNFIAGDLGTGSDGSVTISANKNINTDTIATGRTCADAINYSVTALTSNTATLSSTPAAGCLTARDEILLINLQGISTNYANVGNHETLRIDSISGNLITFTQNKTKYYGNNTNDDSNIGTATTNQRVMLQRVPNYQDITIDSGITLTADAWNGTKGGVLYFRANGTVTNNGTINMSGKGYRYGQYGYTGGGQYAYQGESYPKFGSASQSANFGGGGAYPYSCCGAGGGGAYGTDGVAGDRSYPSFLNDGGGAKGISYGDQELNKLFFGSGGGGGTEDGGQGQNGGAGGGIVLFSSGTLNNNGTIVSKGNDGISDYWGAGGGGSGGSVSVSGEFINIGTNAIQANGGSGGVQTAGGTGGNGGEGRIALYYGNSLSGSASGSVYSELDQSIKQPVYIGGSAAFNVKILDSNTIVATTLAHAAGLTDVIVTNYDGQSATLNNAFTYVAPPAITSISPNSGLKTGGDTVTIAGSDFYGTPTVSFGGTNASSVTLVNATTLSVVVPAHDIGTIDVVITNPDSQTATLTDGFTFNELAPTISSISPTSGPIAGGTNMTISGTNFAANDSYTKLLLHNDGTGSTFIDSSSTSKTITANGNATQTTSQSKFGGSSAYFDGNGDYLTAPNSDDWNFGNGDFTIDFWIKGAATGAGYTKGIVTKSAMSDPQENAFFVAVYNSKLSFTLCGVHSESSGAIIADDNWHHVAIVKNGTNIQSYVDGTLNTSATSGSFVNQSGNLYVGNFNNLDPNRYFNGYIDELRISKGSARWTSNFTPSVSKYNSLNVTIGGQQATNINFIDPTTLTTTTPANTVGTKDVTVTNYDGQSTTLTNAFTYVAPPTITSISPNSELKTGGDTVTISGTDFYGTPTISFGGTNSSSVTFVDSNTLSVVVPANNAGPVDVVVTNPDGQTSTLSGGFTYIELAPTISSITPISGPTAGGTNVTISGTNFTPPNSGGDTGWAVVSGKTLPGSADRGQMVVIGDYIYCFGGYNGTTAIANIYRASVSDPTTWIDTGSVIPSAIYGSSIAIVDSKIYIFGGYGASASTNVIYSADISNPTNWTNTGKTLPGALNGSSLAIVGDNIYLFGGANGSTYKNVIYTAALSDPTTWIDTTKTLPSNLYMSSIAVIGDNIYLFGGITAASSLTNAIYSATTADPTNWSNSGFTLPASRSSAQLLVNGDYMYFLGGYTGSASSNAIYSAPISNPLAWSNTGNTLSVALRDSNVMVMGDYAYLFSGYITSATNAIYRAPLSHFRPNVYNKSWITNWHTDPNLIDQTKVTIDGVPATNMNVVDSTTITATTPANTAGATDVTVTNYDGQFATLSNSFTYINPPTITSITPDNPTNNQSPSVTISGQDFQNGATIKFTKAGQSDIACTNASFINSTTLTCDADFHGVEPGAWTVNVTNQDGQSNSNNSILNIIGEVTQIKFATSPLTIKPDTASSGIRIALADVSGREVPAQDNVNVDISTDSITGSFSSFRNDWQPITQISFNIGESSQTIYYKDPTLGTFNLSAAENPDNSWTDDSQEITISKNAPYVWPFDEQDEYTYDSQTTDITNSYAQLKDLSQAIDFGTGSDGSITISANKNINTDTIATSRTCADAINYSVTALTTNSATLSSTPDAGCLTAGDEILLINLQGISSNYANVGNYETLRVESISGNLITFTQNKTKYYGNNTNDDSNIGTATTNQRVMLQRVPNYTDVTIDSGITLTANAWNGTKGGVLLFKANGTVTNNGTMDMSGKGYRGGNTAINGESYAGLSLSGFGGGGGGVRTSSGCWSYSGGGGGGGGGYGSLGATGQAGPAGSGGQGGVVFGVPRLVVKSFFGGAGGGGGEGACGGGGTGGNSGGIINILANSFDNNGDIKSNGLNGTTSGGGGGGGGAGGSVSLSTVNADFGTNLVMATGGLGSPDGGWDAGSWAGDGGNGGNGRIAIFPSNEYAFEINGTTNPTAYFGKYEADTPSVSNTSATNLSYSELTSFTEDLGPQNQGSVKYQLSNDGGSTWYWWNGSTWTATTQEVAQANDAATINSQVATFHTQTGQVGIGQLAFKAYLISDGTQQNQLDSINVGYKIYPYKYVFTQVPSSLSETEVGTFVVQGQDQDGNVMSVTQDTTLNLATSDSANGMFAIDLLEDESTRWDHTSVTIPEGSSSATFYYTDALKGDKTITATSADGNPSIAASTPQHIKSRYRFLVTGISDPVNAGVPSSVTVNAIDYNGNPTTDYTGTVHFASTDAAAILPANFTFTEAMLGAHTFVNGVTMMTQGEWAVSVTDVIDADITGTQTDITVDEPLFGTPSKIVITTPRQYVPVSTTSSPITVQMQDVNNDPAARETDTVIYISHDSPTGQLSLDGTNWVSGTLNTTILAGATSKNIYFKDTTLGEYSISFRDDELIGEDYGITNTTQEISITTGEPVSFELSGVPATLEAGVVAGPVNVTLKDVAGNTVSTFNDQPAYLTSSTTGEFSLNGIDNWVSTYNQTLISGESSFTIYYRNTSALGDTLTVSDTNPANGNTGLIDDSANVNVTSGQIARYVMAGVPSGLIVGQASPAITIQAYDQYGNVAVTTQNQEVYLYSSDTNTQFSENPSPFTETASVTMEAGTATATFSVKQNVNIESITITASDNATSPDGNTGIVDATQTIDISAGNVTRLALVSANPVSMGAGEESQAIQIESRNTYGVKTPLAANTTIYFHTNSTAAVKEFSLNPGGGWSALTQTTMVAGSDTLTIYYKDTQAGSHTLTIGDDADVAQDNGITNAQLTANISSSAPASLDITSAPFTVEAGTLTGPITIHLKDQYGNTATAASNITVNLAADNTGLTFYDQENNAITSLTITSGTTNTSFRAKSYEQQTYDISVQASGLTQDNQQLIVNWGSPQQLAFIQYVVNGTAGNVSGPFTVELRNSHGVRVNATANTTINFATSKAGTFGAAADASFDGSFVSAVIEAGQAQTSFHYKPTASGTHVLTAQGTGLNYAEISHSVSAANATNVTFATSEQTVVKENISAVYTLISRDQFGNEAPVGANEDITLYSNSTQAEFSRTQSPWNSTLVTTIAAGQSRTNFYYKDYVSGVHQIEATSQFNTATQNVNVVDAPVYEVVPTKYLFQGGAQTFIVDNEATFGFFLADNSNNYAKADREITATISSNSGTGQFYESSSDSWVSLLNITFAQDETIKSFKYRDSAAGNPTITISGDGLTSASQQQTVENGNIEKIVVAGTSAINTTDRIALTISLKTNTDLLVRTNQDASINLFSDHAQGRFYASASSGSAISSTTINDGYSQKVIYFQKTVPGDVHLSISESPEKGWTDATKDISVTAQGTHLRFTTTPQTKVAGTESDELRVQLQDYYGNVVQAQDDIALNLSSASSFAKFSLQSGAAWSDIENITLAAGTDRVSFYTKDTAAGTHVLTVSEDPDSGISDATQNYTVTAAEAHSLMLLSGATQNLIAGQTSAPITVQLHDQYGNAKSVQTDTRLYISASSTNAFFSLTNDFSPSQLIESFVVPAGSSVATFYFKDTVAEHVTISISSEDPTIGMSKGVFGVLSAFADEVDLIGAQAEIEVTMGDPARLVWESLPSEQQAGDDSVTATVKLTNQYYVELPAPNDIPIYFASSSSEGEFALTQAGPWDEHLAGNMEAGESRLTIYYRDTQVGSPLLSVSDVSSPVEDPDTGLINAAGYVDVVPGNPTKIIFVTSPQTVTANHESNQMTVQLQNQFNIPTIVPSDTLIYLRSTSPRATFSTDGSVWGVNGVIIHAGEDSADFFYRDPIFGTPTVTVADSLPLSSDTGLTNATQQQTIDAQVVDRLHVTNISDPQYQGTPNSMVVRILDSEGYVVETYDGTLTEVKAYDSSDTEETAILPEMPYTFQPDIDRGIKTFTNAVAFLYNGEKKVVAKDDQGHTGQQEDITVTTPPAGTLSRLKFIEPSSALSIESDKQSQLITVQLQNENEEPWNTTEEAGFRIRITSSSDNGTFSADGTDWDEDIELVIPKGLNYASFYYRDTKSGSFTLLATDWEGLTDNEDIENDTLEGTTAPDVAATFALSGNDTQIAGETQNLSIIARDIHGNIATGYTGIKTITLSGASTSPSGKKATCKNSSNDAVELGLPTDLEFSAGVAVCELDLYAAEIVEIEATDGTITTIDNQDQDLNVTVSPNVPHAEQSILSASPNPQMISSPVRITVAPKDRYGNVSVDSTKEVIASISGANTVENLTLAFNETSKLYEATYAPVLPGTDLIRVKLAGVNIQKDTEGTSDGIFHETVEGKIIEETACLEKLSIDSYNSDSFILAVCVRASDEAQSDKIDRSKSGDSDIYQLTLEADSNEDLEGKLEFTSYAQKPDSHELDDRYADSDKYDAYKFFRVKNDFVTGKIKSATIEMRISKSWVDEGKIQNITAVRLDSSDSFSMNRTDTESADYYIYQFEVSDPEGYWAIMGEKGITEEPQEIVQIDQPQQPVQLIQPIQEQTQLQEEEPSEEEHETLQQTFSSPIDNVFANIISSNDPQQLEEAKRIANVVAGTAATAAAIPMLPNILGLARMLSAMPLKRRKKWGIVYDADSGEPVAHALISIIGSDGRVKEVKTTDQNGSYFFNARAGAYTLEAFKEGYEALSNVHSDSFHTFYGQSYDRTDVVALQEDGIVSVNVPLHLEEKSSSKELFSKSVLMHAIFWAGFIISGFALILHPGILNLTVFAVFVANFVVNTFIFPTLKGSKVTDVNGLAVPFASIKIFDVADDKLVMRTTTNEKGIFAAILSPGEYELQIDAGTKNLKMPISTRYHKELRRNIKLM